MRNYAKKHPVLGLSLLAIATVSLVPLVSCKSTGIADLYMSPDDDGARNQSVFYAGEPVNCILKMNSGRMDETLLVKFRPLEANGDVLDLPAQLVKNAAPGKTNGIVNTPFPVPAVVAFANPMPVLVAAANSGPSNVGGDIQSRISLINDIRAKMLVHFADGVVHHMPDTSAANLSGDANSDAATFALYQEVKALYITHISSTEFHDFADTRDLLSLPTPDPTLGMGTPSLPALQATTALSSALIELKNKLNAHISTIVVKPGQTAGKYRCEVTLADQTQSVDFVILPGGIPEPPPMSMIPRVGQCNGDPVANCPDPMMKGPNILKCCTMEGACGSGPKGTPFCY